MYGLETPRYAQTFLPFLDARSALDRQYLGEASVTCKHAAYLTCHNTALYTCVYTSKLTCVSPHGLRRTDAYAKPETGCLTQRLAETSEAVSYTHLRAHET